MSNGRASWYERVSKYGKQTVILEEMLRLGFWPPDPQAAEQREEAIKQLEGEYEQLAGLRSELGTVEKQISQAGNLPYLLQEIRKKRIERVRQRREERKQEKIRLQTERRASDKAYRLATPPFLGQGVSAGLRYTGGDPAKLAALGLPALENASDIARAIGIEESELSWLTYHRGAATIDHYHRFTIPKRSGGLRVISSPKRQLRVAQSWLLQEVLLKLQIHEAAMAFRPGRSIVDNALQHRQQAVVIRLDLKDFFPSIRFRRVKGLFESFGYNEGVASILALLATEAPRVAMTLDGQRRFVSTGQRQLPQGACTSPALTNILCRKLDSRLSGLARRFGFTYTRYADDLVFSHPRPDAPLGQFLSFVKKVIEGEGFVLNPEKTAIMRPQHRQAVTGLVVNNAQPALSRSDLRRFRAFLHHCETQGFEAVSEQLGKNALGYARGYLAFIQMVSPAKAAQLKGRHPWLAR
jgi:hypothetical protein